MKKIAIIYSEINNFTFNVSLFDLFDYIFNFIKTIFNIYNYFLKIINQVKIYFILYFIENKFTITIKYKRQ